MPGGRFNYDQDNIRHITQSIREEIEDNDKPWYSENSIYEWEQQANKAFFESGGKRYSDETIKEFEYAIKILRIAYVYAKRIDWLLSGDESEEEFHKRLEYQLDEIS